MSAGSTDTVIRVAGPPDARAVAELRALWSAGAGPDAEFEQRMASWLAAEGERRTTWLATISGQPVGMVSLLEYRRMPKPGHPDSHWGYLGNMFVREPHRNRGIGSALLAAVIATADARGYARLVLSPAEPALEFFRRAGFAVADGEDGADTLLVRPGEPRSA